MPKALSPMALRYKYKKDLKTANYLSLTMKFYTSTENMGLVLVADPCGVNAGDVSLTYASKDAVPFVVSRAGEVVFGKRGTEHQDIEPQVGGLKNCMLRGRLWLTPGVLTVWERQPRRIGLMWVADEIKRRFGINPEDIRFFFEVTLRMLVVELPLSEYLRLNISGDQITWFRQEYARQQKLKNSKNNDLGAKMDAKNIWRHYEMVGENTAMKFATETYLNNYINRFRKALNLPDLDVSQLHFVLFRLGVSKTNSGGYLKRDLDKLLGDRYYLLKIRELLGKPVIKPIPKLPKPEMPKNYYNSDEMGAESDELLRGDGVFYGQGQISEGRLRAIVLESVRRVLNEEYLNNEKLFKQFYECDWDVEPVDRVDDYCTEFNIYASSGVSEFRATGYGMTDDKDDIEIESLFCKLPSGIEVQVK